MMASAFDLRARVRGSVIVMPAAYSCFFLGGGAVVFVFCGVVEVGLYNRGEESGGGEVSETGNGNCTKGSKQALKTETNKMHTRHVLYTCLHTQSERGSERVGEERQRENTDRDRDRQRDTHTHCCARKSKR